MSVYFCVSQALDDAEPFRQPLMLASILMLIDPGLYICGCGWPADQMDHRDAGQALNCFQVSILAAERRNLFRHQGERGYTNLYEGAHAWETCPW